MLDEKKINNNHDRCDKICQNIGEKIIFRTGMFVLTKMKEEEKE